MDVFWGFFKVSDKFTGRIHHFRSPFIISLLTITPIYIDNGLLEPRIEIDPVQSVIIDLLSGSNQSLDVNTPLK